MTGRLAPQPWMTAPETVAVLDALEETGAEVRFIGGCVRDALLNRAVNDVDLATDSLPEAVVAALEAAGIKAVPTGLLHGTITAVSSHRPFEITTLRHDVETDGRHATVAFTDDWEADAARRDFTFNALSLSRDGTLHDPFGGEQDLRDGIVRFVGDPKQRIEEDVLRLLRFFRFHAHYAAGDFHAPSLEACRALASRVPRLSVERVWSEMKKLLAAPDPAPVVRKMAEIGALASVLPDPVGVDRLDRLVPVEKKASARWPSIAGDAIRRTGALLPPDGTSAGKAARHLKVSTAERARLVSIADGLGQPPDMTTGPALRRLRRRLSQEKLVDLALVLWAESENEEPSAAAIEIALTWTPPDFPLSGRDVTALDVKTGPDIGRLLTAVEDWWIAEDFAPDRDACLARLQDMMDG